MTPWVETVLRQEVCRQFSFAHLWLGGNNWLIAKLSCQVDDVPDACEIWANGFSEDGGFVVSILSPDTCRALPVVSGELFVSSAVFSRCVHRTDSGFYAFQSRFSLWPL